MDKVRKFTLRFHYNSPVVLTFVLLSALALLLNNWTNGYTNRYVFSVYRSSFLDPLTYIRLFGHVLGHVNRVHFTNNIIVLLLVGPMLEEKYGSRLMLRMILITAFITGIINNIFFPHTALIGASGVVFMMILLASMASAKEGSIPLTLLVTLIVYLGQEIMDGLFTVDNISHISHIIGGLCGVAFGYLFLAANRKKEY